MVTNADDPVGSVEYKGNVSVREHGHRQTIARYYTEREVARIFERNRLLFHLRNLGGLKRVEARLLSLDPQSWADVFNPAAVLDTLWKRPIAFMAPQPEEILRDRWKLSL